MARILRNFFGNGRSVVAMSLLLMPLLTAGEAGAMYLLDGTKETGPGIYDNPNDGFCVVGIKPNGDMLVDKDITNARDCGAYTTGLTGLSTQANCAPAAVGSTLPVSPLTGWRHAWSNSVCTTTGAGGGTGVSRVDLDNTTAMCTSKGGTLGPACVAYGWFYRGVKPDGTVIPITGGPDLAPFDTANYAVWQGATSADGLGFCHRDMNFTNAPSDGAYVMPTEYPWDGTPANECPMFDPLNPSGRQRTPSSGWSDYLWNWNFTPGTVSIPPPDPLPVTGNTCRYAYGVRGLFTSAINSSVAGNAYNTATKYDLTTITTQGLCTANGLSWENWVPTSGYVDAATRGVMSATPCTGGSTDCYAAMDLTTLGKDGGAKFVSRQCQRCHSDQSRSAAERDKPGYVYTGHKLAGDSSDPAWAAIGDAWGLKGAQCAICHASANPQMPDIVQVDSLGDPIITSAHTNAQYGAAVTHVCYTCHSDATLGVSANTAPGSVIPVSGGHLEKNAQNLDPIVNQFLNSPHAEYTGDNSGAQIQDAANYGSTFKGKICRANGFASGTILTTVFRAGEEGFIHFPDSATNEACTNPGDGSSASGAAGAWVDEGDSVAHSQGNCMTCHDVHWSLESTNPESDSYNPHAEPLRRHCTTCHVNDGVSASGAQQIDLATINHLATAGTPLENWATNPDQSCESCHMPLSGGVDSSLMHLWRISTDPNYETMGVSAVNLDIDGKAWIDVDLACGQCHGGGAAEDAEHMATPPALYRTKAQLALVAEGMHDAAAVSYPVTFSAKVTGLDVVVDASVQCGGACPVFTYDWNWGDGSAIGSGDPAGHTYATGGKKTVTLTVRLDGKSVGSVTRSFWTNTFDLPPTASATCDWDADSWTLSVTDTSTDADGILSVKVDWDDDSGYGVGNAGDTLEHVYRYAGTYNPTFTAIDTALKSAEIPLSCNPVSPAPFTISGTVYESDGTTPVVGANVIVKLGRTRMAKVQSAVDGTFSAGNLKPGNYKLKIRKRGFTFAIPAATMTIGPDSTGNDIDALTP